MQLRPGSHGRSDQANANVGLRKTCRPESFESSSTGSGIPTGLETSPDFEFRSCALRRMEASSSCVRVIVDRTLPHPESRLLSTEYWILIEIASSWRDDRRLRLRLGSWAVCS